MITGSVSSPLTPAGCTCRQCRSRERSWVVKISAIALLLLLSGCATITTPSGNVLRRGSPEFREYAGDVFQRQNATLVSMFDVFEYANDADTAELDRAEQGVIDNCAALNSAASARRDGKTLDVNTLRRVADSIVDCDTATLEADQVISRVQASALSS